MNQTAYKLKNDDVRLRYFYRSLILHGKLRLSLEAAKKLIGPDCAYHLYSSFNKKIRGK